MFQQLTLAVGGAAAVAAHGGHEKRFRPEAAEMPDDGAENSGDVRDATAAGGNCHALALPDPFPKREPRQLPPHFAGHVFYPGRGERLPDPKYLGEGGHRQGIRD